MAVQIKRDADFAMPKALAGHFRVNAIGEQMGGMGMPKVMESKARKATLGDLPAP